MSFILHSRLAVAAVAIAFAQDSIRVDVDIVNVLCTVRDSRGALVNHLTADDFILLEEGKPQIIKHFTRETGLPLTVGLLVDTSNSQIRLIDSERRAAAQFLEQVVRPRDSAFLMSFDAGTRILMEGAHSRSMIDAGLEQLKRGHGRPRGTVLYDAVRRASEDELSKRPGRKAILLITDGMDVGSKARIDDAINAAQRADAIVYGIYYVDPKAYGSAEAGAPGQFVLDELAEQTGGRLFRVSRSTPLKKIFDEIQAEMRSQYSLEFTSSEDKVPGQFRRLEVLLRPPGLKAQSRKGYYVLR